MSIKRLRTNPAGWLATAAVVLVPAAYWDNVYRFSLLPQTLVLQGLVLIGFGATALTGRRLRIPRPLGLPVLASLLATAASVLICVNPVAGLSALNVQIGCVLLFLLICNGLDLDALRTVLQVGAATASLLSVLGLLQYFGVAPDLVPTAGLPSATLGHRNMAAAYLVAVLPFTVSFYLESVRPRTVWLWAGCVGLQVAFLVATRSRGAWVAVAVAAAVAAYQAARTRGLLSINDTRWVPRVSSAVVILLLAILPAVVPANIEKGAGEAMWEGKRSMPESVSSIFEQGGDKGRLDLWRRTLQIIADWPIMGIGSGNWRIVYPAYAHGDMIEPTQVPHRPHNTFLSVWSETGTVGLVLFAWVIVLGLRMAVRACAKQRFLGAALLGSLTAVLVNSLFGFPHEFPATWMPFYVCLAGLSVLNPNGGRGSTAIPRYSLWGGAVLSAACLWLAVMEIQFDRRALPLRVAALQKDWRTALREADLALAIGPFDEEAYLMRGLAHQALGANEAARRDFESGLRYNPNSVGLWNGLGNALRTRGDRAGALAAFRRALHLDPESARALNNVATLHASAGELDSAVAAYERAARVEPGLADLQANLSIAYRRTGKVEQALAAARRAVDLEPGNAEALSALGSALIACGQAAKAGRAFASAVRSDPSRVELLFNLAVSQEAQGLQAEALQTYRRFLRAYKGPENPYVAHARERLAALSVTEDD